jgi:hypothetical protein
MKINKGKASPMEMLEQLETMATLKDEAIFRERVFVISNWGDGHSISFNYEMIVDGQRVPCSRENALEELTSIIGPVEDKTNLFPQPEWSKEPYMKKLGYELIRDDGEYAKFANAGGTESNGYGPMWKHKRTIYFNRGYTIKREGELSDFEPIFVGIQEDGDTRTVFNGVVDSEKLFIDILNAVR